MSKVLRALLASGLLVFMFAVPAFASTSLHQTGLIPYTDANEECEEGQVVEDGMVFWHFILNGTTALNAGTLTATFVDGEDVEHVVVIPAPSKTTPGGTTHWDTTTPQDWVLNGDKTTTAADGTGQFNLSHVCPGGPPPEIPEAPLALLLPLMALTMFGGYMVINRRRATAAI